MVREMIVVPYDRSWQKLYWDEKTLLTRIFGKMIVDIQHFGSTSIEEMWAKPIIDIMIVVEDIELIDTFNQKMEANGYIVRGENGIPGRRYFVKLHPDKSGNHTHHVHIFQKGDQNITDQLMFRDYLRIAKEAFTEYEKVKKEASVKHRHSPLDYTDAKTRCVVMIMAKARAYFLNRS